MIQYRFQRKQLTAYNPFPARPQISPREQLITHGLDERYVDTAVCIWNELASSYQINPAQMRGDDKIADIASRDWFGDSGLSIEAKLTAIGAAPLSNNATVFDLVLLLVNQEKNRT